MTVEAGAENRTVSGYPEEQKCLPLGPCTGRAAGGVWLAALRAQLHGPFRNLQSERVCCAHL